MLRLTAAQQDDRCASNLALDAQLGLVQKSPVIPLLRLRGQPGLLLRVFLPGKHERFRVQVVQRSAGKKLRRPVFLLKNRPQRPFLLRVVFELLLVAAHPNELFPAEPHWSVAGRRNLKQHHRLAFVRKLMDAKVQPGLEQASQPVLQFLVALLCLARLEARAHDLVHNVLNAPDDVGPVLAKQSRRIRQGRQILAHLLRVLVVALELDLLDLGRQRGQLTQQGIQVHSRHLGFPSNSGRRIWPVIKCSSSNANKAASASPDESLSLWSEFIHFLWPRQTLIRRPGERRAGLSTGCLPPWRSRIRPPRPPRQSRRR